MYVWGVWQWRSTFHCKWRPFSTIFYYEHALHRSPGLCHPTSQTCKFSKRKTDLCFIVFLLLQLCSCWGSHVSHTLDRGLGQVCPHNMYYTKRWHTTGNLWYFIYNPVTAFSFSIISKIAEMFHGFPRNKKNNHECVEKWMVPTRKVRTV